MTPFVQSLGVRRAQNKFAMRNSKLNQGGGSSPPPTDSPKSSSAPEPCLQGTPRLPDLALPGRANRL